MMVTTCSMFALGCIDGKMTGRRPFWRGLRALLIGAIAAAAVHTIGRIFLSGR
jgi:VIT1/CCC1 family predicted Fe2+/Mn2+ transporter